MSTSPDLADRYGSTAPWRRPVLLGACAVVAATFLGWLGWVAWEQSTPEVRSSLVGYDVIDDHRADATIEVRLRDDGVAATCTLRAYAEDHTVVGELSFTPEDGTSTESVRTERLATSVELVGCTSPGQNRPR